MKNGKVVDGPITEVENYKYDKYGNLINYTGIGANRNNQGEPIDQEHTTTYVYDYDKYHSLKLKTFKQDADKTQQTENTIDNKGNITKSTTKIDKKDIVKEYVYDKYGNITQQKDVADQETYVVNYEYSVDAKGKDYKGAYLTKKYITVDKAKHETTFAYNNKGELTYEKDPNGNITTHEYDILGRTTVDKFPDNTTIEYNYEQAPYMNLAITVKDRKGTRFKHIYDINGKELEESYYTNNQWKKQYQINMIHTVEKLVQQMEITTKQHMST